MPRLTVHLLGPPLVELDGSAVQLGRHKAVALLAYLALTRQPHSRDALATLLWPELDQSHARGQLRRTLSLLNRTLGEGWLAVDRETAAWAADAEAWIDVEVLRERLAACATHGHPAEQTCAECVPLLEEAVDLYRDGFLAGFTLPDAPGFDEWQFFEGEGLRDEVADALQRLARWYGDHGEYDAAIPYARRWLALDPLHEPAQRVLMALYARSGQRAAALRQYAECERVLQEELGVPPSPETIELYERIRDGEDLSGLPNLTGLRALPPHNLPEQLTPFVGREKELAELSELLVPTAEARLVTVVGPGGMGKTRLALEAASRQLDRYPDGVWVASLAPLQSADVMVPTVAQTIGMSFHGTDPPRQQLLRYLREKRTLLVLDNLEHLLEGVDLLVEVLRTAPGVRLLVTSRLPVNLRGEQVFALGGMDYPELPVGVSVADEVRRYDSVTLFLRSARRVRSGFELGEEDLPHVARICHLAQGMPLAILLAAAWVPALPPVEIAAEMERSLDFLAADWRDEPERHHSMRAVFDATWGMLTEGERQAFARLSVFRGGFTREAAQPVAGTDLRALVSLVNKSLLQRDRSGRYEVHELLRQYAGGKLAERPLERDRILDLHCAYYSGLLDQKAEEIEWGGYGEMLREVDNARAAWQHAVSHCLTAELAKLLAMFELPQWSSLETYAAMDQAANALRSANPGSRSRQEALLLGRFLNRQAFCAYVLGREEQAAQHLREGEGVLCGFGETDELAETLYYRACMGAVEDRAEAEELLREVLGIDKRAGREESTLSTLSALGEIAISRGAYQEAEQYCQEALEIQERFALPVENPWVLTTLSYAAYLQGEYDRARGFLERCLAAQRKRGWTLPIADTRYLLGHVSLALGEYEDAVEFYQEGLARFESEHCGWSRSPCGFCRGSGLSLARLGDVALAVGDETKAEQRYVQALRVAAGEPHPELKLEAVLGQAKLLARQGNVASSQERAAELATLVLCHPDGLPETRDAAQCLLDEMQTTLSPQTLAAAQERGRSRNLEATMRELLAEIGEE